MKKILSIFLLTVMILAALTGCSDDKTQSFQSMEDFDQAKIGVLTGSSHDKTAHENFPNTERFIYNFTFYDFFGDAPEHARDKCFVAVSPVQK